MTEAHAETEDGRAVLITQDEDGGAVLYFVADDRFADGWRPIEDPDDRAELTASINRAQAARAVAEVEAEAAVFGHETAGPPAVADEDPAP